MILVGLANVIGSESNDKIDNLVTPGLTFATIIITLIHIIGPTSGCHINPAVTISLTAVKRCHIVKACLYIIAQFAGAITGAAVLYGIAPQEWIDEFDLGINKLNPKLNMGQGLVVEIIGTMILVLLVLVISDPDPKKDFEGFPSLSGGMAVLACVLFMAPYTGCSLNPARSFAPALIMLKFHDFHWIYWVGPITGGLIADLIYSLFLIQGLHKLSHTSSHPSGLELAETGNNKIRPE